MKSALLVVALLAIPILAWGQAETTGRISGEIKDESGNPIAAARVTFLSPALAGERPTETDALGRFLVALLPVGPYAVNITAGTKGSGELSDRRRRWRNSNPDIGSITQSINTMSALKRWSSARP